MRLDGKTALITGGNSGIGLAAARRFVAEGARVAITGRNQATLDAASKELGPKVVAFKSDVLDAKDRAALFSSIGERFGHLDVVFANAGIAKVASIADTSEAMFDEILRTNVTAAFLTVQAALPLLRAGASIILNSSVASEAGAPGSGAYAASKAAVRAMSRSLAGELSLRGIRVNVVTPGIIKTPIWGRNPSTPEEQAVRAKRYQGGILMDRFGEADEVAKVVLFLASDDSSYVQAEEIIVDGGMLGAPSSAPGRR
jgi:NAD(P)-dependent dehydrogenase (short-subunit alcohol dehydrogenase family)